jgi:hypothetical protein
MRKIQVALGKWFARSRVGDFGFEIVEIALIAQIQLVNEDRRIFVGIRIVGRIIHASATQALRWARTITLRNSSGERPLLLASAARFFMAGFSRIPSTALIFVKPARPSTKPVLLFCPVERFCFGMFGIYHIFSGLPCHPDECSRRRSLLRVSDQGSLAHCQGEDASADARGRPQVLDAVRVRAKLAYGTEGARRRA